MKNIFNTTGASGQKVRAKKKEEANSNEKYLKMEIKKQTAAHFILK